MSKLLVVFGATGNQGGSVIKALLADAALSRDFKIRGITRDVSKPAAQALAAQGVEVVAADLDSKASLAQALTGSHTVFLVTTPDFASGQNHELAQGRAVADAAVDAGVAHLVYSSLLHGFFPGLMGQEMLENHLFIDDPGYYAGKGLEESWDLLAGVGLAPTTWKEFLGKNKSAFQ